MSYAASLIIEINYWFVKQHGIIRHANYKNGDYRVVIPVVDIFEPDFSIFYAENAV